MKRIAIITGASSGMGRRFAQTAAEHVAFDELWVIARREDRLLQLQDELKPVKVVPVAMDLSVRSEIAALGDKLKQEDADVVLLINAAGFGKFLAVKEVPQSVADEIFGFDRMQNLGRTELFLLRLDRLGGIET